MFARHFTEFREFTSADGCALREIFNPAADPAFKLGYSLAHAALQAGSASLPHRLDRSEVYYIIAGSGVMHIDAESRAVTPGATVYIPPGAVQYIENAGEEELEFVCMVDPGWTPECDKLV
ncbi:MAG: cupin domain-containing protein [Elusimicrobiaceae bacterium]|nr:cupin domain-containing protein [Elusimicrobiaceae bacterium]